MTIGPFCKDFTFFDFRGIKTCFLLRDCTDKRPKCTVPTACVSGRSSACGKYCPQLTHHEEEHIAWRCQGGINPYNLQGPHAQLATMSSQARWRYQARSHLEHIFWWLTHRHAPPSNLYMSDLDSWLDSTPF